MTHATLATTTTRLRPAIAADVEDVTRIWHLGWRDGHLGHVPDALLRQRQEPGDFRGLVLDRLDTTTVATVGSQVVGFVTVHDDEVQQIYVDAAARGTGVATTLLGHGEVTIGRRFDRAWLAVVAGNARARRFYERHGWSDAGRFDYVARTTDGATIAVPAHRYEKRVAVRTAGATR
jgi:ribosomal protein S18 acetylase RimI-like enzyme